MKKIQQMYDSDGSLTLEEAMKRIDITKGDASFGLPVPLNDDTVIMGHLTGGTVNTVRSEGLYLFAGPIGKMKPLQSLSFDKAKALVIDTYSSKPAKPKREKKAGALLDSPYYYDEIRNEIDAYLKELELTLGQDLLIKYKSAVADIIADDGSYTIVEAVKKAFFDIKEKIYIEQGKIHWQNNSYKPPEDEADRGSYNHGWHESNNVVLDKQMKLSDLIEKIENKTLSPEEMNFVLEEFHDWADTFETSSELCLYGDDDEAEEEMEGYHIVTALAEKIEAKAELTKDDLKNIEFHITQIEYDLLSDEEE
ncbi:hypothetical protein [Aquamicrobium sp.]|uniref:hypothetical protein n=1 Tax=Aquamicrobium sp. TaxID=1872579 RepID=UPI002587ABCC|nr:hypothetical protein [Aquamicrobium sp.]MCK9553271.1 hypothetical protein [Aquamicrobium sp.]